MTRPARGCRLRTPRYALFVSSRAAVTEVGWRTVSTATWVTFTVVGLMGLTLVFTILQVPLLKKEGIDMEKGKETA